MAKFILKGTRLKYNGVRYYDGDEITINDADITADIRGYLTPVQGVAPKVEAPAESRSARRKSKRPPKVEAPAEKAAPKPQGQPQQQPKK